LIERSTKPTERVIVLVKALPHAGRKHGETVCCAGITERGEWRRQFPIHFRRLSEKFARWDLIEYEYREPRGDKRSESRRVQEDTIKVVGKLALKDRANLLNPLVVASTAVAAKRGQSLALIRPQKVRFDATKKTEKQLAKERRAYAEAARQGSFFDKELSELKPCPYAFIFEYQDEEGKSHTSTCDDWETAAMYRNFEKKYGEAETLRLMKKTFEKDFPAKGMAFAMGTHSKYPEVWLLVGIVRLEPAKQLSMAL
jgi:hypothetical protein